jgi:2-succinyl-6-hydroxy-2,4-cyclohexadiene-1-carboxylate synthase
VIVEANGIDLNVEDRGSGPPVLLLHGFTGSSQTWGGFGPGWPELRLIAVDLPGHGRSDSPSDLIHYSIHSTLTALNEILDQLDLDRVALLGYSLGARIALHFALGHPGRVSRLVLESASPGIEDSAEREQRRRDDEALAEKIEKDGLEAFVDYWQALPLWESQAALPAERREALRRQRLQNSPTGLANSLRGVGAGACPPVHDRLGELMMPLLVIAGELDRRYTELAGLIAARAPDAKLRIIANAGHAVHLEQPEEFGAAVSEFLATTNEASLDPPRRGASH